MSWKPDLYLTFADDRLRPGFELLARVGELPAGAVFDLGCGTGTHARAIAGRWPEREVFGVDSSPEMLAEAAAEPSSVRWLKANAETWTAPDGAALIFSNAVLHWIDDHPALLPRLIAQLVPGGTLALQMPRNFAAQSHALMRAVAADGPWAERLRGTLREEPVLSPMSYYDILVPYAARPPDIWQTEYQHVLTGATPVLDWMRATGLRPVEQALDPSTFAAFCDVYQQHLAAAYPRRADGHTLFAFNRLFICAVA